MAYKNGLAFTFGAAAYMVGSTLASSFVSYQVNKKRLNDNDRFLQECIVHNYDCNLRPLLQDTMKICRKWTNTKCSESVDIIPFLEKYAELRALDLQIDGTIQPEHIDDYDIIEKFRESHMAYWMYDIVILKDKNDFPKYDDIIAFSTFHWAVYMAMNSKKDQPYAYEYAKGLLSHNHPYIDAYRKTINDNLPRIQEKNVKTTNDK